jgi:hypothetical protein
MRHLALVPAVEERRLCGDCSYGDISESGVRCRVFLEVVLIESTASDCPCFESRNYVPLED